MLFAQSQNPDTKRQKPTPKWFNIFSISMEAIYHKIWMQFSILSTSFVSFFLFLFCFIWNTNFHWIENESYNTGDKVFPEHHSSKSKTIANTINRLNDQSQDSEEKSTRMSRLQLCLTYYPYPFPRTLKYYIVPLHPNNNTTYLLSTKLLFLPPKKL